MSKLFVNAAASALGLAVLMGSAPSVAENGAGDDDGVELCIGQPDVAGPVCVEVDSVITDLLP